MEHSGWYGGQTHPYHLQDPSAGPAQPHLHNAAEQQPPPVHHQRPPFEPVNPSISTPVAAAAAATSAQNPYHAYDHPPNPNPIPTWTDAPAPVSSHLYEPAPGAAAAAVATMQPPDVGSYAPNPYTPYAGYDAHGAHYGYPPVVPGSYHHGLAGGETRSLSAKEAIRQYGVDPVEYGNFLGRPPDFSMHQKKATHPHYDSTRKKDKKIRKVVQSAYCKVCKVDCNSQEVLVSHRQGKKHKKNLEKLKESIAPKPAKAPPTTAEGKEAPEAGKNKTATEQTEKKPATETTVENKEAPAAEKKKTSGGKNKKKPAPETDVDLETKKRRLLEEGATEDGLRVCTICNIVCNSEVVFNYHVAGQKHAAMVKKQAVPGT